MRRFGLSLSVAVVVLVGPGVRAQNEHLRVESGFEGEDRLIFSPELQVGGLAHTRDGELLVFQGAELLRFDADGASVVLTSFDTPVFGSFLTLAPGGEAVLLGESSNGNIYRVPVEGGSRVLTDTIAQNYDLAFDQEGRGLVSARADEMQRIVLLDDDPGEPARPVIVNIPGFSGPLAFDGDGNLYYGTATFSGPAEELHRFTREQVTTAIASGGVDFSVGEKVLESGSFAHLTAADGKLLYTNLGFTQGFGSVHVVDIRNDFSAFEVLGFPSPDGITSPTYLTMIPGVLPFEAGSGVDGGVLVVVYSDFGTVNNLAEVTPQFFFLRGELNGDGVVDISDVLVLLGYVFLGQPEPDPVEAVDSNADGAVDIADAVYILNFLFLNGPPLPAPFPNFGPAPSSGG